MLATELVSGERVLVKQNPSHPFFTGWHGVVLSFDGRVVEVLLNEPLSEHMPGPCLRNERKVFLSDYLEKAPK